MKGRGPNWHSGGAGVAFAILLLLVVEAYLHQDAFLLKYRSVFAAGRAMDKLNYVEAHRPRMLILGDSRVDNGFDPEVIAGRLPKGDGASVFNLGLPGADARVLYGVVSRLSRAGMLGPDRVAYVVIGLDEGLVQSGTSLGYEVFFADRHAMWLNGEWSALLGSTLRLWGFADHFKELREPARLERFAAATLRDVDPVGGPARTHLGYRAGFGELQDAGQSLAQEVGSLRPPSPAMVDYFFRTLDLLHASGVQVAILYPPLLNRAVLYRSPSDPHAPPFLQIGDRLNALGIPQLELDAGKPRVAAEFLNAGHLNDLGAKRYSGLLADQLCGLWEAGLKCKT